MRTNKASLIPALLSGAFLAFAGAITALAGDPVKPAKTGADRPEPAPVASPDVLAFTVKRLDGADQPLADYRGKVVLIVNTASKCGLTPQYKGLEALYQSKKDQGFVVLGFPANNFGNQEPGSDAEITDFCAKNYGVMFPMFSKISVKGEDQHPIYQTLTGLPAPLGGDIRWNFEKFLVDRSGKVIARFDPKTKPDAEALVKQIDEALARPAPGGA